MIQTIPLFCHSQFRSLLRQACLTAKLNPGSELCGLLVDSGYHVVFVQTRNISRRAGSFSFSKTEIRRVVKAAQILGQDIVGTFHSHPVGIAQPSLADIANAVDDSLMFIFDCTGKEGRLWKIRNGKARPMEFRFIHGRGFLSSSERRLGA
jgi:proteasome lid subunit RPN8/RPN11